MAEACARIVMNAGMPYIYDQTRGKLLSMTRIYLRSGVHSRNVSNQSMRLEDGQPAFSVGDGLLRDATITGISLNCETTSSWIFEIYKQGTLSPIATLNMLSNTERHSTILNINVNAGDVLLFKLNGTSISFPRGLVEMAWRI